MTEQEEDEAFWRVSYNELNSVQIEARTQLISVQRSNQRLSVGRAEQTRTGGQEEEGKEKCSPSSTSTQSSWKGAFLMLQKAHDETKNRLSRARELNGRLQNDASIARVKQTETEECPADNLITNHPASGDTAEEKTPSLSSEDLSAGVASISSATVSTIDNVGDKTTKDNDDIVLDEEQNNEAIIDIMIGGQAEEEKEDQEVNESRYIYYDKTFTKTKLGLSISQQGEGEEIFVSKIYDNEHKGTIEVNDVVVSIGTINLATLQTSTTKSKAELVQELVVHQTQRPLTIKFSRQIEIHDDPDKLLESYEKGWQKLAWSATSNSPYTADNDGNDDEDDDDDDDGSQEDRRKVRTPITPTTDAEIVIASNSRVLASSKDDKSIPNKRHKHNEGGATTGLFQLLAGYGSSSSDDEEDDDDNKSIPNKRHKHNKGGATTGLFQLLAGYGSSSSDDEEDDDDDKSIPNKRHTGLFQLLAGYGSSSSDDEDEDDDDADLGLPSVLTSEQKEEEKEEKETNSSSSSTMASSVPLKKRKYCSLLNSQTGITDGKNGIKEGRRGVKEDSKKAMKITDGNVEGKTRKRKKGNKSKKKRNKSGGDDGDSSRDESSSSSSSSSASSATSSDEEQINFHTQQDVFHYTLEKYKSCKSSNSVIATSLRTYQGRARPDVENSDQCCGSISSTLVRDHVKSVAKNNQGLSTWEITEVIDEGFLPMHIQFDFVHLIDQFDVVAAGGLLMRPDQYDFDQMYCYYWEPEAIQRFFTKIHRLEKPAGVCICFKGHMVTVLTYPTTNANRYLFIEPLRHGKLENGFSVASNEVDAITSTIMFWMSHLMLKGSDSHNIPFKVKFEEQSDCHERNKVGFFVIYNKSETTVTSQSNTSSSPVSIHDPIQAMLDDNKAMDTVVSSILLSKNMKNLKGLLESVCERNNVDPKHLTREQSSRIKDFIIKRCHDAIHAASTKSDTKKPAPSLCCAEELCQHQDKNIMDRNGHKCIRCKKHMHDYSCSDEKVKDIDRMTCKKCADNLTLTGRKSESKLKGRPNIIRNSPRTRSQGQKDNVNAKDVTEEEKEKKTGAARIAAIARGKMAGSTRSQRRAANNTKDVAKEGKDEKAMKSNIELKGRPRTRLQTQKDNANVKDAIEKEKETRVAVIARGGMAGSTRSQIRAAINEINDINESNEINEINDINESNEINEINPVEPRIIFSPHTRLQRQKDNVNAKDENEKEKETGAAGITAIARGGMAGSTRSQKRAAEEGKDETTTKSNNESEIDKVPEVEVVRTNTFKGKALRDMKHHKGSDEDDGKATMSPPRKKTKHCNVDKPPAASGFWSSISRYLSGTWLWNSTMPSDDDVSDQNKEELSNVDNNDADDNGHNNNDTGNEDAASAIGAQHIKSRKGLTKNAANAAANASTTKDVEKSVEEAFDDLNNEDFSDFLMGTEEEASIDKDYTDNDNNSVEQALQLPQKRGMKKGATWIKIHSAEEWYDCVDFFETKIRGTGKFSKIGYLKDPVSGLKFEGTSSEQSGFTNYYKRYNDGWNPYEERKRKAEELEQRKKKKRRKTN